MNEFSSEYKLRVRDTSLDWQTRLDIGREWVSRSREFPRQPEDSFCKAVCTMGYRQIIELVPIPEMENWWNEAHLAAKKIRPRHARDRWLGSISMGRAYKSVLIDGNFDSAKAQFLTVTQWGFKTKCDTLVNSVRACAAAGLDCVVRNREDPRWYEWACRCFRRGVQQIKFIPDSERIQNYRYAIEALDLIRSIRENKTIPEYTLMFPFNRCVMAIWEGLNRESQ